MRVLQIATSTDGGAGIAARRLNGALNSIGIDSRLLSGSSPKLPRDKQEFLAKKNFFKRTLSKTITVLQFKFLQKGDFLMTPLSLETISIEEILRFKPDLIHLHTFYNLLSAKTISSICASGLPVFISLHDERFYTGGCHHAMDCSKFQDECLGCPETKNLFQEIVFRAQKNLAEALTQQQSLTVIAPSDWIANRARKSKVLATAEVVRINNPLSSEFITSSERRREKRNLQDSFVVTFVAQDLQNPYKGLDTLLDCIRQFEQEFKDRDIQFAFVGTGSTVNIGSLKAYQSAKTDVSKIIDVYFNSDLLIVPSLTDNSPNVIFEALVCGTPFVGSDRAGIPEISAAFGMESFKFGDPESMFQAIVIQKERVLDSEKIRTAALALVDPLVVARMTAAVYKSKLTAAN